LKVVADDTMVVSRVVLIAQASPIAWSIFLYGIAPTQGNGVTVTVTGLFWPTASHSCVFGTAVVPAVTVSETQLTCVSPTSGPGAVTFSVREAGNAIIHQQQATFYYTLTEGGTSGPSGTPNSDVRIRSFTEGFALLLLGHSVLQLL
jgi:hypothetical protein